MLRGLLSGLARSSPEAPRSRLKSRASAWRVKLRITIAVAVVSTTVCVAGALLALNYWSSAASVHAFTRALLDPIAGLVAARSQSYLDSGSGAALLAADLAGQAKTVEERLDGVETIAVSLLRERAELFYVQYGDAAGNFEIVSRAPGKTGRLDAQRIRRDGPSPGTYASHVDAGADAGQLRARQAVPSDGYDPRTRPWYQVGIGKDGLHWTDAYVHAGEHQVITAARAVRDPSGSRVGVASAAVSLEALSAYLATLRLRDRPARVFLVDSRKTLLASSTLTDAGGEPLRLPLLSDVRAPELARVATTEALNRAIAGVEGPLAMDYALGGVSWLGVLRPLALQGGRDWIIGAVVPEDDFLGEVKDDFTRGAVVSVLVIAFFVVLTIALASSIAKPLGILAEETRRIQTLDLADRPLPDSIFEEVAELNDVLSGLKTGLRAFGKYVPVNLVRILLAEGVEPTLGGRVEELTILFTDVREFTAFAEEHDPAELARVLGAYLKMMTETVGEHGGTVDKFIGDAVMAFWNAPRPVEDHTYRAVLAAVRCRDGARALDTSGALYTRFGLHTARVAVGNFGAPERFAYTALGDGVNLASRLEGANKEYGTEILISEETHALLDGRLACRRLDKIAVKGRKRPTAIYEVLGTPEHVDARLVAAAKTYEAALSAYETRDFARAAELFRQAALERPGDRAAEVMRARAERFCEVPPPADWNGVYTMQAK